MAIVIFPSMLLMLHKVTTSSKKSSDKGVWESIKEATGWEQFKSFLGSLVSIFITRLFRTAHLAFWYQLVYCSSQPHLVLSLYLHKLIICRVML